jgi:hypothetical protein
MLVWQAQTNQDATTGLPTGRSIRTAIDSRQPSRPRHVYATDCATVGTDRLTLLEPA